MQRSITQVEDRTKPASPSRRLSERVSMLQQVLPLALLVMVMFYQVTRHLIFPASDHPAMFAIEFLVFGLGAPAMLWLTLNWIAQEIRAREAAEDQADTRTRMLLEMQHRIKNNLQTVADLLSLELARPTTHPNAAQSLRDSVTRIKTIAAAHELLTADQVGATDILELATRVAENARLAQIHPGQNIQIRVTGESVRLNSKAATAFALVINELVSNTFEHGFADGATGEVEIGIATDEQRAYIVIQDSGVGLPEDFDPKRDAGLGLRIVRTLIEKDLRGTFTLDNVRLSDMPVPVNGARAEFSFPI
ncbi:MAG: sensor histidine kinase [Chloroflexi bacterium]|nr:sensor histidine kinase [Chloroflexota bacterium]